MYNSAASGASFPKEVMEALIITVPKPGKPPNHPVAFHPNSFLNTDPKVYAKIIRARQENIIPLLIHSDQVGFCERSPDF